MNIAYKTNTVLTCQHTLGTVFNQVVIFFTVCVHFVSYYFIPTALAFRLFLSCSLFRIRQPKKTSVSTQQRKANCIADGRTTRVA